LIAGPEDAMDWVFAIPDHTPAGDEVIAIHRCHPDRPADVRRHPTAGSRTLWRCLVGTDLRAHPPAGRR
jgi:hypothetical protein